MKKKNTRQSTNQKIFRELVLGTLVYSVVIGYFNDYTDILHTGSYSVTFAVAIVLQILTFLTLWIKRKTASWFQLKTGKFRKYGLYLSIWLILFLSKFIFLIAIDFVFAGQVEISGFFGLILIILCMTFLKELIDYIYRKLA